LCTFFLALFLGFSKRRTELAQMKKSGTDQRPVLTHYTVPLLDSIIQSTATMAIMCYALFTAISGKNPTLIVTVPIVHYGIMRYKLLLLSVTGAEEPDRILLKDRGIRTSVLLWVLIYLTIVYLDPHLFR
ncbi:MAG: hypothetical protein JWO68_3993, partial [Actinomycetia bacterium]|nr:hypothetical protein [Actinomycetes bacterium]